MSQDLVNEAKRKAAYAACDAEITSNQIIGVGSGSTVVYFGMSVDCTCSLENSLIVLFRRQFNDWLSDTNRKGCVIFTAYRHHGRQRS